MDRDSFYSKWLAAFPIRIDAQEDPEHSTQKFCEQMGLVRRTDIGQVACEFSSEGSLWRVYSQILAEGEVFVPSRAAPAIGSEVRLQMAAGEVRPPALLAQVLWSEVADARSAFL